MNQLQSEQVDKIMPAFVKAQKAMNHAIKDKKNSHLGNDFASLEAVIDAAKEHLLEAEIAVFQPHVINENGQVVVVTTLLHTSGQWLRSYTPVLMEKSTCQSMGSGLSYSRRYALSSMCCIGQMDDDGNEASGAGSQPQGEQKPRQSEIRSREAGGNCPTKDCSGRLMNDKFVKGGFYCPKCGLKQRGGAA